VLNFLEDWLESFNNPQQKKQNQPSNQPLTSGK
jgi:hypothetical protein